MSEKKHRIIIGLSLVIIATLIATAIFVGLKVRSSHLEGASIVTELDTVDSYITQGDTKKALQVLKRAEKRALSAYEWLGIYKRYVVLSENAKAEKCLVKALHKFPQNEDLTAVYGNFLLRHNRIDEALKVTKKLSSSAYSSIYAESVLRLALASNATADEFFSPKKSLFGFKKAKSSTEKNNNLFYDKRFIPIYTDAFKGSAISKWGINAATLLMAEGNYTDASLLSPQSISSIKDALFWGIVFYDSCRYAESLQALSAIDSFDDEKLKKDIILALELKALESDVYYILGDNSTAQVMRNKILDSSAIYPELGSESLAKLLPLLYMNTVIYEKNDGNYVGQYTRLFELLTYYPTYEPGLASYAEYAIQVSKLPEESESYKQLRSVGLRTLAMEQRDAIPIVSIEEVISMVDDALKENKKPALVVLKEELQRSKLVNAEKIELASRVWKLLEENELDTSLYPPEVMHYVIITLIQNSNANEAESLFTRYLNAAYGSTDEQVIKVFDPAETPEKLRLWECEVAAFFAVKNKDFISAQKIYEYVIKTYGDRTVAMNTSSQESAIISSFVNMANIYSGYNKAPQALSMLNKAVSREADPIKKAEILYRIAVESYAMGNEKDAVRSVQYALSLNPSHNRARLLLKQL